MSRWLAFLGGMAVAGGIAYVAYKVFVEPAIKEQRRMNQTLWSKIQELQLRAHELERDWSQNVEEHKLLRDEIDKLSRTSLSLEMRSKLQELLSILDTVAQRQRQVRKNTPLTVPIYVT